MSRTQSHPKLVVNPSECRQAKRQSGPRAASFHAGDFQLSALKIYFTTSQQQNVDTSENDAGGDDSRCTRNNCICSLHSESRESGTATLLHLLLFCLRLIRTRRCIKALFEIWNSSDSSVNDRPTLRCKLSSRRSIARSKMSHRVHMLPKLDDEKANLRSMHR